MISNTDLAALATGRLGQSVAGAVPAPPPAGRSVSAVTACLTAETSGFRLANHNGFFSSDFPRELEEILRQRPLPSEPTVCVCAEDRHDDATAAGPERLHCLVNAPAIGDRFAFEPREIEQCLTRLLAVLERSGLTLEIAPEAMLVTTPTDFERLFPATRGALYGMASHSWQASFQRPAVRTKHPGVHLAGGSVHPGRGLPMATFEDAPFWPRSLLATRLCGRSATAVHESLSLDRFALPVVQAMLPFRKPRPRR